MIREAAAKDIPQIVEWGARFHAMSGHPAPYVPERAAQFVANAISSEAGIALMHDHGFIIGVIAPIWFSSVAQAAELSWWAERDGMSLFKAFERESRKKGAAYCVMAHLENESENDARVARIYERRGYRKAETGYIKEL